MLAILLLLLRVLPPSPAQLLSQLALTTYLLFHPACRAEIRTNYRTIMGRDKPLFWLRNACTVGRNLALMARIGQRCCDAIVDRTMVYTDNICGSALERELHHLVVSFHFGLWECLPQVFARQGYSVALVVGRQRDPLVARQVDYMRQARGVRLDTLKSAFLDLDRPGLTGFMLDNTSQGRRAWVETGALRREVRRESEDVARVSQANPEPARPTWPVKMKLPVLPFELSRRRELPLRPAFCRMERGRLRVDLGRARSEEEVLSSLVEHVRSNPEEWVFWGKAGALSRLTAEAA
jgi:hypothetical protein